MKNLITTYLPEVLLTILTALYARLTAKLISQRNERKALKNAICALLRDRIIGIYNRYSEKEYFPIHERENLQHLTKQYYSLGGNGIIKNLEAKLTALPTDGK